MTAHEYQVLSSTEEFRGAIFTVTTDEVAMPGGGTGRRDITHHRGAAAVVALDEHGQVVLIRQYRHAVRGRIWELPAGLCDVPGESGVATARRELAEEVDVTAQEWQLLVDVHPSPGFSDELVRIYLARGLSTSDEPHARVHEEADLTVVWVDLDEAVAMALRGEITNGPTVAGLLAAARARDADWAPLRPAD